MQVVFEDYIHVEWLKVGAIIAMKFAAFALGAISAIAVLRVAFGS